MEFRIATPPSLVSPRDHVGHGQAMSASTSGRAGANPTAARRVLNGVDLSTSDLSSDHCAIDVANEDPALDQIPHGLFSAFSRPRRPRRTSVLTAKGSMPALTIAHRQMPLLDLTG